MAKHLAPEPERPARVAWRRVALVAGVVFLGLAAVVAGFAIFQHKSVGQVLAEPFVQTPQQVFGKDHLLVLAVGLDYDYNNKDEEYSTAARSDVIKAIALNFDSKKVAVLSVLRDMVATMPDGRQAKINEAQSEGGIKEAQSVIASFLGTPPFDRYVILRINSMKEIINAIGGIDVNVKDSDCVMNNDCKHQSSLDYDDNWGHLFIHLKPGMQHLNGDKAVGYSRFRHDWCGDPCRSKRQEQVVQAIVNKLRNDKINTLLHAGQLIDIVRRNVTTNLTQSEMIALANYFIDIKPSDIAQAQAPILDNVTLADGGAALLPDQPRLKQTVRAMLLTPPTPEPSPDAMALASIPPSTLKIDVQNGSGVPGVAHRLASALKAKGFAIGQVGNAPADVATTEIHEHSTTSFAGAKVRVALPAAFQTLPIQSEDAAGAPSDVTIVVGKDYSSSSAAVAGANPAPTKL